MWVVMRVGCWSTYYSGIGRHYWYVLCRSILPYSLNFKTIKYANLVSAFKCIMAWASEIFIFVGNSGKAMRQITFLEHIFIVLWILINCSACLTIPFFWWQGWRSKIGSSCCNNGAYYSSMEENGTLNNALGQYDSKNEEFIVRFTTN